MVKVDVVIANLSDWRILLLDFTDELIQLRHQIAQHFRTAVVVRRPATICRPVGGAMRRADHDGGRETPQRQVT